MKVGPEAARDGGWAAIARLWGLKYGGGMCIPFWVGKFALHMEERRVMQPLDRWGRMDADWFRPAMGSSARVLVCLGRTSRATRCIAISGMTNDPDLAWGEWDEARQYGILFSDIFRLGYSMSGPIWVGSCHAKTVSVPPPGGKGRIPVKEVIRIRGMRVFAEGKESASLEVLEKTNGAII
jgi:hypothetical protein